MIASTHNYLRVVAKNKVVGDIVSGTDDGRFCENTA